MSRVDETVKLAGDVNPADGAKSAAAVLAFDEFRAEHAHRPQLEAGPRDGDVSELARSGPKSPRLSAQADVTRLSPEVDVRIVVDDKMTPPAIEQYRRVATSLLLHQRPLRTLIEGVRPARPTAHPQ